MTDANAPDEHLDTAEDLKGLGGWLYVPLVQMGLTVAYLVFQLLRELAAFPDVSLVQVLFRAGLLAFCAYCVAMLWQERKIAGYLMIAVYGLALLFTIATAIIAPAQRDGAAGGFVIFARGGVELALLLYFAFSKRVQQTFVN